ncbi:MAG TPA: primosomal protein N', partial [Saprospiraceae bacterium]|nr:primosomal protein N' [Saprospiraceae bacterium]
MAEVFVNVLLPLAVPKPFTYLVPDEYKELISFGIRVEVQMGKNKLYAGIVVEVHGNKPAGYKVKSIVSIIDRSAIITLKQWELWKWMAEYYCCHPGEIMNAALPAHLKLSSETQFILNPIYIDKLPELTDKEYLVAEALQLRNAININDVRLILDLKNVFPVVNSLIKKGIIFSEEEIKEKYKILKAQFVRLKEPYRSDYETLRYAFDEIQSSEKQTQLLLAYVQITRTGQWVKLIELIQTADVSRQVILSLSKKNIFEIAERDISRIDSNKEFDQINDILNEEQQGALDQIQEHFITKNVVLLHGITGSGKTHIYTELSKEYLSNSGQVLYLLPEIALTTQIISRLQKVFGHDIVIYHSRMNNQERVEVWEAVMSGKKIILSARSGLFLPFKDLKLIIVDEEHDSSYKQDDPNPRYQGRDLSIFMASLFEAKVILGSATPSIESYKNARDGKYGLVNLMRRFGGIDLPEYIVVDLKEEIKSRKMQAHFSSVLLEYLQLALERKEQGILFQNRRGYAPLIECTICNWTLGCPNCDVNLTYHKSTNSMRCHYCGFSTLIPVTCPACG